MAPRLVAKVKKRYINKPDSSDLERQVAYFCNVNRAAIRRSKKVAKIITRKKRKAQLYKNRQLRRVKTYYRKFYDKTSKNSDFEDLFDD